MARYEHLPLYKTAMDLTVSIETVVRNISRYHKYTLGTDLRQQSRATPSSIAGLVFLILRWCQKACTLKGRLTIISPT
jgi:hypothetical protein